MSGKRNILESEIEAAFIQQANRFDLEILGRQVPIMGGIMDILCWDRSFDKPAIVEVKKGKAPASIYSQLVFYMLGLQYEIQQAIMPINDLPEEYRTDWPYAYIVAEEIDEMTERALFYSGMRFIRYILEDGEVYFQEAQIESRPINTEIALPLQKLFERMTTQYFQNVKNYSRRMIKGNDIQWHDSLRLVGNLPLGYSEYTRSE